MGELRIQNMKVGEKYVSSTRKMVTKTDVETFCTISGMLEPLFLSDDFVKSDERWKKMGLKGAVVPGQLTYAIMLGNLASDGLLKDVIVQLGGNNIRWPAACYQYDILRTEGEITGSRTTKAGDSVIVDYHWQLKNQNDVVVIEGDNTCMFRKK